MKTIQPLSTQFPADSNSLEHANTFLEKFASSIHLQDKITSELLIVLDELLSNSLKYGLKGQHQMQMTLAISLTDSVIKIKYSDDGFEFNPFETESCDLSLPIEEREIGGLGINLVRGLTDSQSYKRENNRNLITLTRKYESIC